MSPSPPASNVDMQRRKAAWCLATGRCLPESVGLELVQGGWRASSTELRLEEQFEEGGSERATGNRRLRRNFLRRCQVGRRPGGCEE
ncbi:hypothetical protein AK812_SmicGene13246 [Symbiodinium microadriaticum]|uniref:Uncharacterized protein n=1 Tax=Symbiodinium microadriaticum TaxID=2951 RepID=A0A1Q9E8N4_SYMMI|nr:hypothetical protein AK812_SmicGene13246 [Symbiodinium microadriaticum]